ncbi:hypothetical protein BU16DRAFT_190056 [Lophium mytilinum]|uniref:Uncharacterized protein n=1 Tax=Lophium mytilinum TaxID=390894 RepID=A0A6A6R8W4_9PEZI|nr:hypothetical protein BU16DRAFT_190056 [Lophium mytilinum]
MAAYIDYLKALLSRADANGTLLAEGAHGIQSPPNDEPATATKASNLARENLKSLESLLAENDRSLPDQIREKLLQHSRVSTLSGRALNLFNLLMEHKTETVYTTIGAVTASVLGYLVAQYVARQAVKEEGQDHEVAGSRHRVAKSLEAGSKTETFEHAKDREGGVAALNNELAKPGNEVNDIEGGNDGAVAEADTENHVDSGSLLKTWAENSSGAKDEGKREAAGDHQTDVRLPTITISPGPSNTQELEVVDNKVCFGTTNANLPLNQTIESVDGDSGADISSLDLDWEVIDDEHEVGWVGED